jgi:Na+-driven multidrug efflux pump
MACLNALGHPVIATCFGAMRLFVLWIPIAYLAGKYYGFNGLLMGTASGHILGAALGIYYFHRSFKKIVKKHENFCLTH